MEYLLRPLAHPSGIFFQNVVTVDPYSVWNVDVARLRHEREILENGLANCVTYLHALRKKQARNERHLNVDPLPPRKKRKKIQQSNRELSKEIKNRERDEQAFLNNLRGCKATPNLAEGISYMPTEFSSTGADYASSATQYSYGEPGTPEFSWKGWADNADVSLFNKQRFTTAITKEVAPDEFNDEPQDGTISMQDVKPSPALHQRATTDGVPTACSRSSLSPDATIFEPTVDGGSQIAPTVPRRIDKLNDLSWLDAKALGAGRARDFKGADISTSMQHLSLHSKQACQRRGSLTWCNTSPQESPREATSRNVGRDRRDSF